ncbi:MAG: STAS/SEC14 domain-containing protein [bacterium]|nr:STAS/SEC14 domain-containing protein [bacterium]
MFKVMENSHHNIIGLEADGIMTKEEIIEAEKYLEKIMTEYDKINWLCVWENVKYENLSAFYEDMKWLFKHLKKFDRMAIVGDKWWKMLLVKADGLIFGERYFDICHLDKAWDYIEGKE